MTTKGGEFAAVWQDGGAVTLAIPTHAVDRYKFHAGRVAEDLTDDEIRAVMRKRAKDHFSARVELSEKWGHEGFAISVTKDGTSLLWLIFNPDRLKKADYVLITVYTDAQFQRRMAGQFFSDADLSNLPPDLVRERRAKATQASVAAPMEFRVECAGEDPQEFDDEEKTLRYLEELAQLGYFPNDWSVWKKVKSTVSLGG